MFVGLCVVEAGRETRFVWGKGDFPVLVPVNFLILAHSRASNSFFRLCYFARRQKRSFSSHRVKVDSFIFASLRQEFMHDDHVQCLGALSC